MVTAPPFSALQGDREYLREVVDHVAHFLPTQGPMGVFVHHNTLHSLQHQPFESAVLEAAQRFGAQPFLPLEQYRRDYAAGRILEVDLQAVVRDHPDVVVVPGLLSRHELQLALLRHGLRLRPQVSTLWMLSEEGWLSAFRSDLSERARAMLHGDSPQALWQACSQRCTPPPPVAAPKPSRPREAVLTSRGLDLDLIVHPPLIRLVGAFLDQGLAYWPMPNRELGLLQASRLAMTQPGPARRHLQGIAAAFRRQMQAGMDAEAVVLESLAALGVPASDWEEFLLAELLPLRGWAGMLRMLEQQPQLAPHEKLPCRLMDYLALRLNYTQVALINLCGDSHSWRCVSVTPACGSDPQEEQASVFDAAQLLGLRSDQVSAMDEQSWARFLEELRSLDEWQQRRLWHLAYERRHERQILLPLHQHRLLQGVGVPPTRVAAQAVFCIDEREESLRRALEEVDPEIETVGAAGFFGVAIDYAGIDDAHSAWLCPVVVTPAHRVREVPIEDHSGLHDLRQRRRRAWAKLVRGSFISSRTLLRGWISTALLGFLSVFPLVLRLMGPRLTGRLVRRLNRAFLPEPRTEMTYMRDDRQSQEQTRGLMDGFTEQEMADRVYSVLGPAGLHRGHARVVAIIGHGSTSLNNPYESAYCCGACGGRTGAPNARLFAMMANRPGVREALAVKGVQVPSDCWFVGGYHDTCSDDIEFFDLDLMPSSHQADMHRLRQSLDRARLLNAQERVRRFGTAPQHLRGARALRHVQARAEHLAEPRPEYGHCTNAVAFVGRRRVTRNLFMDRRAFLVSYDAALDPADEALARVLGAVIPVCGGISLEYYFSTVDNEVYGSGTKLPHNITGLVGVMNGFQGDLRTGLPLQTVEIHEPVRILFIIETTAQRLMKVVRANPELVEFVCNRWIRVAVMDPDSGAIEIYRGGDRFEPLQGDEVSLPTIESSASWYCGHAEHLPLARLARQVANP
jgi:hypothetical protein